MTEMRALWVRRAGTPTYRHSHLTLGPSRPPGKKVLQVTLAGFSVTCSLKDSQLMSRALVTFGNPGREIQGGGWYVQGWLFLPDRDIVTLSGLELG